MSLKTKLLTTISLICLTIVMLMVGVWAVKTADFKVGGNISFTATGINATISKGTMSGGTLADASNKLKAIEINTDKTQTEIESEFASWSNLDLSFNENGDDVKITFSITNDSEVENEYLKVAVSINQGTQVNATASIDVESKTINPGESQQFVITFKVTDKKTNASLTGFEISFDMQLIKEDPIELLHDIENDYYYVEMGTYGENNDAVRWRVVGVDGNHYQYNGSQAPTGELTFLQETVTTTHVFGDYFCDEETVYEYGNNDYATSAIRQYITGHDCALRYDGETDYPVSGNYLNDLGITENNAVYKKIQEREVSDLYKNINWDGNTTISDGTTDATGADKLWIPSVAEIYSLVGGGDISNITSDWSVYYENLKFYNSTNSAQGYWLRSPHPRISYLACFINEYGECGCIGVTALKAIRPAFILEIPK